MGDEGASLSRGQGEEDGNLGASRFLCEQAGDAVLGSQSGLGIRGAAEPGTHLDTCFLTAHIYQSPNSGDPTP